MKKLLIASVVVLLLLSVHVVDAVAAKETVIKVVATFSGRG